jgi:hypothetical protein
MLMTKQITTKNTIQSSNKEEEKIERQVNSSVKEKNES